MLILLLDSYQQLWINYLCGKLQVSNFYNHIISTIHCNCSYILKGVFASSVGRKIIQWFSHNHFPELKRLCSTWNWLLLYIFSLRNKYILVINKYDNIQLSKLSLVHVKGIVIKKKYARHWYIDSKSCIFLKWLKRNQAATKK